MPLDFSQAQMWQKIFDLFISKFGEFSPKSSESIYEGSG
jgi:hypothetical protein